MEKQHLADLLKGNPYPGRGIVLGKSADGRQAVAVYFIMGRSENSRNRVFVPTEDGIRTEAHDPAKMTDPSLIIYHPVRKAGRDLIVTNGDQTDTVRDCLLEGRAFAEALKSRAFEPDGRPAAAGTSTTTTRRSPGRAASSTPIWATGTPCPPLRGTRSGWSWTRKRRRPWRSRSGGPWTRRIRCPSSSGSWIWRTEATGT